MPDSTEAPPISFKAPKKRKNRAKPSDVDHDTLQNDSVVKKEDNEEQKASLSDLEPHGNTVLAEALRRRNIHRNRPKGVAFRADANREMNIKEETKSEDENETTGGLIPIQKRFAPQTGIIGELVNKHMEEYIESKLAERHGALPNQFSSSASRMQQEDEEMPDAPLGFGTGRSGPAPAPGRAMRGRIMEVDLGEEVRSQNVAMTERATRKLVGANEGAEVSSNNSGDEQSKPSTYKTRLGRDGKLIRSHDRRDSEDIERDRIVEEFMRENRLDVYEPGLGLDGNSNTKSGEGEDDYEGAADDRIADAFKREFMEAMQQRRRRRAAARQAPAHRAKRNPDEPILRGPKLGGSRNARAAMRDKLLEQQIAQQKNKPLPPSGRGHKRR